MLIALRRLLQLLVVALLVGACGAATPTGDASPSAAATSPSAAAANPSAPAGAVHVSLLDFSIAPAKLSLPAGQVTFHVTNDGKTPHNFDIRTPQGALDSSSKIIAHSKDLDPGQSDTFTATLAAGSYTFFCAYAGHEALGMVGTLVVS